MLHNRTNRNNRKHGGVYTYDHVTCELSAVEKANNFSHFDLLMLTSCCTWPRRTEHRRGDFSAEEEQGVLCLGSVLGAEDAAQSRVLCRRCLSTITTTVHGDTTNLFQHSKERA